MLAPESRDRYYRLYFIFHHYLEFFFSSPFYLKYYFGMHAHCHSFVHQTAWWHSAICCCFSIVLHNLLHINVEEFGSAFKITASREWEIVMKSISNKYGKRYEIFFKYWLGEKKKVNISWNWKDEKMANEMCTFSINTDIRLKMGFNISKMFVQLHA